MLANTGRWLGSSDGRFQLKYQRITCAVIVGSTSDSVMAHTTTSPGNNLEERKTHLTRDETESPRAAYRMTETRRFTGFSYTQRSRRPGSRT